MACDLNNGLVGWWKMSNNWTDETGNYDGTPNNSPSFVPDVQGNVSAAGAFASASSQYVDLGTAWGNVGDDPFSVCAWINVPKDGSHRTILSKGQTSSGDFLFYKDSSNRLSCFLNKSSGSDLTLQVATGDWDADTWLHFCATYDGSVARAYVNGVLLKTDSTVGTGTSNAHNWVIGASDDGTARFQDGNIDALRFYNRAITTEEIFALVRGVDAPVCPHALAMGAGL